MGLEPTHLAPEASALSSELRGPAYRNYSSWLCREQAMLVPLIMGTTTSRRGDRIGSQQWTMAVAPMTPGRMNIHMARSPESDVP